jgi:MinD-like ATPase involved in chromosome partitioning or flagellar assembly
VTVRIALAVPAPHDDRLAREALRHGHDVVASAHDAEDLAAILDAARPDVAIVWASPRYLGYGTIADCDARGVRVVAALATPDERRYASGLGLYELVDADAGWSAFEEALVGSRAGPVAGEPVTAAHGTVITVWGPAGAPGRTTLAIAIASEIAAAGHTVVLGDVDTHGASVAPALGLTDEAPGFAAACRLAAADSLTRQELERIGQRYGDTAAGFWVLTGIGQPSRWPELSAERVRSTIEECRRWVDFVVLDTGSSLENDEEISSDLFAPRRNAATLTALQEADHVVAVAAADPIGLARFLRAHGDLADIVTAETITVVANRVRASAIGPAPSGQVSQTLARFAGIDDAVLVPCDQQALDAAVLGGETLREAAPRSPARLAIQRLVAERIVPVPVDAPRRRLGAGRRLRLRLPLR